MCVSCGSSSYQNPIILPQQPVYQNTPCDYTLETMLDWKQKLICASNNNIILTSQAQFNQYMGIILSGINFIPNICYLKRELDNIQPIILSIINVGIC